MSDSVRLSRPEGLKGEIVISSDPIYFFLSCLCASFARGDSEFLNYSSSYQCNLFIEWFEAIELDFQIEPHSLILTGKSQEWQPKFKETIFELSHYHLANLLWAELLLFSGWSVLTFEGEPSQLQAFAELTKKYLHAEGNIKGQNLHLTRSEVPELNHEYRFTQAEPLLRNILTLRHFLAHESIRTQEPYALQDSLSSLLDFFGVDTQIDRQGTQELSELEKRLARLRGIKIEKKALFSMASKSQIKSKQIRLPGDPTVAAALATLGVLTPKTAFVIKNVSVNPSRSGFFTALKRFGYQVEILRRKERQGDAVGDIDVKFSRNRQSRKLGAETMQASELQYPLLSVGACYAEGESILRDISLETKSQITELHQLVSQLKITGAEVGEFDEGLVIRGREECDSGDYDGNVNPRIALALYILCQTTHGQSNFKGIAEINTYYSEVPKLIEKLQVSKDRS